MIDRGRIAANGSTISTSVLIYMALHDDDALQFGCKRLCRITDKVNEYSHDIDGDGDKFTAYRNRLDGYGLNLQLKMDFTRALLKGLKYTGGKEMRGAEAGVEATYTLIFLALHDLYHFGPQRMKRIQERIKSYAWFIRDGTTHILEYMKCLSRECGLQYQALNDYEAAHGEVQI